MNHPDLDRLTLWIHGFLESGDAAELETHVSDCRSCRDAAQGIREEANILSRQISSPERLSALQAGLLQAAAGRRFGRGLLWQVPVAAAVLFGLVSVLLSNGPRHRLIDGRLQLQDGRVMTSPTELAASQEWQLRALDRSSVRLSDRSTVDLDPGTQISLSAGGARGVQPDLASGHAEFSVAAESRPLTIVSPAGRVDATDGRFSMKIVFQEEGGVPVKNALAGALVTVFAGSLSLSNAGGRVEAQAGQSAVLARTEAPLLLLAPQEKQEELLRRLEQLAARVAKLEEEVTVLELKNKELKLQLQSNAPGAAWGLAPGQNPGGVRIIQSGAGGPGSPVIIELKEENEKKPETKQK